MTRVRLHPPVKSMSGKMGIYTYRVMYGKQTLMKTPDMSKVKWSKAQKRERGRFAEGIAYARQAMTDPQLRTHYEKLGKDLNRQPFRVAVSDFLRGRNLLDKQEKLISETEPIIARG